MAENAIVMSLIIAETPTVLQETELLAAGFPCIDVSRAGLRRGLDGQVGAIYSL
jgi:site-specific DNA-cytosine methylase